MPALLSGLSNAVLIQRENRRASQQKRPARDHCGGKIRARKLSVTARTTIPARAPAIISLNWLTPCSITLDRW